MASWMLFSIDRACFLKASIAKLVSIRYWLIDRSFTSKLFKVEPSSDARNCFLLFSNSFSFLSRAFWMALARIAGRKRAKRTMKT